MLLDTSKAEHYDLLTALSGPGLHYLGWLKWLVSGYIRHKAGIAHQECVTRGPLHFVIPAEFNAARQAVLEELRWLKKEQDNQPVLQVVKHWTVHSLRGCNRLLERESDTDTELKLLAAFLGRLSHWLLCEIWDEKEGAVVDALEKLFAAAEAKRG